MKFKLAIVTQAHNEKYKLPRWVSHYSRQVARSEDLYVIDHATDDGSTSNLGSINLQFLPINSGAGNFQSWRADYVSKYCSQLLERYDYVVYVDTDELLVADPLKYRSLYEYVSVCPYPSNTAVGFDVLHNVNYEGSLDGRLICEQRATLQFVAAMCKPVLINNPTSWTAGFHYSTLLPKFGDLFLFHLRYADLTEGLERLHITRNLPRPDMATVSTDHQKISDETFRKWVESWLSLPRSAELINTKDGVVDNYIKRFSYAKSSNGMYVFDYSFRSSEIFTIPRSFQFAL